MRTFFRLSPATTFWATSKFHTVSEHWAPLAIQSLIRSFLKSMAAGLERGLYVPRFSKNVPQGSLDFSVTINRNNGCFRLPTRLNRMLNISGRRIIKRGQYVKNLYASTQFCTPLGFEGLRTERVTSFGATGVVVWCCTRRANLQVS